MKSDRFVLGPAELVSVRFGLIPGAEALRTARRLLYRPQFPLHRALLTRIAARLPPGVVETFRPVVGPRGYTPDFLVGFGADSPEAALEAIRRSSDAVVATELARMGSAGGCPIPSRWSQPSLARRELADAWESLWFDGIAPEWPRMRRVLEADIAQRSRLLAHEGLAATIATLQPNLTWDGSAVVRSDSRWGIEVDCTGQGLLLVPTIMAWPRGAISTDEPWPPTIFYPAHHASALPETTAAAASVALMGRTRAAILAHLVVPARSVDVATAMRISAATASHHLTILRDAGLIMTNRVGTEAWHTRTPVADDLSW